MKNIINKKKKRRHTRPIRYISLFSGVECATLAVEPLGWTPIRFAEIEPFPCAVLAHRFPEVPNAGDVTRHDWSLYRGHCDVVIGGSPCQSFSVAGRRQSLADRRGNLTLCYVEAVNAIDPYFAVWENVPGALSTKDNAFGQFLGVLAGCRSPIVSPQGRKWPNAGMVVGPRRSLAWRVLDAQFFGVPQRRRRVFLVGCPRTSGFDPAEILFERESLCGHSPARREARKTAAGGAGTGARGRGESGRAITGIAHTLRGGGSEDGTGRGIPLVAFTCKDYGGDAGDLSPTLRSLAHDASHANGGGQIAVAFTQNQAGDVLTGAIAPAIGTNANATGRNTAKVLTSHGEDAARGGDKPRVPAVGAMSACGGTGRKHGFGWGQQDWENGYCQPVSHGVRRLTPRECERLQGLPDDHTLVPYRGKPAADGPRYKAIGNGMAVPCVGWVLRRVHSHFHGSGFLS